MKDTKSVLEHTIQRCRERNIIILTYEEMVYPEKMPRGIKDELKNIGLWDLHPWNLFRILWKNEPIEFGGRFGGTNYMEVPKELFGIKSFPFGCKDSIWLSNLSFYHHS